MISSSSSEDICIASASKIFLSLSFLFDFFDPEDDVVDSVGLGGFLVGRFFVCMGGRDLDTVATDCLIC